MKKAFSLVEVIVSITIFSIVIIFLYQTLDMTKTSNNFYEKNLNKIIDKNTLKEIVFEDLLSVTDTNSTIISVDKNKNSILQLQTINTFHNPLFNNITYLLSKDDKLLRIESLDPFNFNDINDYFLDNSYIDILYENIDFFYILKNKNNQQSYTFSIKLKNNDNIMYFTTLSN